MPDLTDDDRPPAPDMKLRRLAIDAGLIPETDVDKFHAIAEALGLIQQEQPCKT